ncbi:hypothetical protein Cop2CBH44_01320 [Coprobacter secundus subsp. similis]|uniref:Uncharacterized protein n=1 Tax=Coprobacter secundus subsp. similis TaxID=2751153 RepID=A0A7G1HQ15_9BACT|nr:hypothetical protein Cop2CBH44_01320 [Coprobacter secundus subsp. similis]
MLPYTAKHFARRLSAIFLPLPRVLPSHTPQSPLERGSYPRYKSLVINKKTAFQTFLFRRRRGRCCQFFCLLICFGWLPHVLWCAALFRAPALGDITGAVFLGFVEYLGIECGASVLQECNLEGEV